jgi:hypothetical protein
MPISATAKTVADAAARHRTARRARTTESTVDPDQPEGPGVKIAAVT